MERREQSDEGDGIPVLESVAEAAGETVEPRLDRHGVALADGNDEWARGARHRGLGTPEAGGSRRDGDRERALEHQQGPRVPRLVGGDEPRHPVGSGHPPVVAPEPHGQVGDLGDVHPQADPTSAATEAAGRSGVGAARRRP